VSPLPGACAAGTTHCADGSITCAPNVAPTAEACNGVDDDCNGATDEGDPGGGPSCDTGIPGVCAAGTMHCVSGGVTCVPEGLQGTEICDGIDNDCDGVIDNIGGGSNDDDGDGVRDCQDNCPLNANPAQTDADGDGLGDACDNCQTVPNPDQNPCACAQCFLSPVAERTPQGGAVIRWTTTAEVDVLGFNIVEYVKGKRVQLTPSLIPCQQCATGLGASYAVPIAKHKSARNLSLEQLHTSGLLESFPVVKNW
jgi:hypothetical protein